jgi:hypothetical protein
LFSRLDRLGTTPSLPRWNEADAARAHAIVPGLADLRRRLLELIDARQEQADDG